MNPGDTERLPECGKPQASADSRVPSPRTSPVEPDATGIGQAKDARVPLYQERHHTNRHAQLGRSERRRFAAVALPPISAKGLTPSDRRRMLQRELTGSDLP